MKTDDRMTGKKSTAKKKLIDLKDDELEKVVAGSVAATFRFAEPILVEDQVQPRQSGGAKYIVDPE